MASRLFEEREHAALYQKYRVPLPSQICNLVLNYLQRKKGKPFSLAVDIGCGSGQSTRGLAAYFEKVIGIDASGAQIEEARKVGGPGNISFRQGLAEKLEFEDGSVDLIIAGAAVHWFDIEMFMKEVERVLKPKGCVALYCYRVPFELHYNDCSEHLTQIVHEMFKTLAPYESEKSQIARNEYKEVFDAIMFPDKERVDNIPFEQHASISWIKGFFESLSYYQTFQKEDPKSAKASVERMEQNFLQAMGVASSETVLEIKWTAFCLLASKPE
ncbi:putative methyltransferase DDB_G0268948 isoform X1 [Carcharodon carcharias]|uniref:putative methyltransferase DDB_G0268948 isoform X1 n=1 Tax=Carcharodon carcharias TaxID=13397 RepID=UPI001B7F66A7|nr:putative methyltransferase DDB_G0268948 isoform X1 [Carcharodon carcharias]